jgi:hypothetical protein
VFALLLAGIVPPSSREHFGEDGSPEMSVPLERSFNGISAWHNPVRISVEHRPGAIQGRSTAS